MVWREKGSEGVEERDGGSSPTRRASPASTPSLPLPTIVSIINGGVGWGGQRRERERKESRRATLFSFGVRGGGCMLLASEGGGGMTGL